MKKKEPRQKEYAPPVDITNSAVKHGAHLSANKLAELIDPATAAKLHALSAQRKRHLDAEQEQRKTSQCKGLWDKHDKRFKRNTLTRGNG